MPDQSKAGTRPSTPKVAVISASLLLAACANAQVARAGDFEVTETDEQITISTPLLEAGIRKKGYVSGVYRQTFLDKQTGFRDAGFGSDIVDWIMEPGSDKAYRDRLDEELIYRYDSPVHGKQPKRSIEGPQICTKARELDPQIVRGKDFVAVKQQFRYRTAAPGRKTGSLWTQWLVFPNDTRYFISMDKIDAVNSSNAMFLRIDMPGHIRHDKGDTFSEIYLSYSTAPPIPDVLGKPGAYQITEVGNGQRISSSAFFGDFAPDQALNYRRDRVKAVPQRFIRAYRLRNPETGEQGPWLAGMTLDPAVVHEAWCHQRNYVCMIEEFGGQPIKAGESFSAAFIVGYFDSIDEMHRVYDAHKGHTKLEVTDGGWKLMK